MKVISVQMPKVTKKNQKKSSGKANDSIDLTKRHHCDVLGCPKHFANRGGLSKHKWREHSNKREENARFDLPKGSVNL